MLKVENGVIQYRGTRLHIMSELAQLINHLWETEDGLDKDDVEEAVKVGFMPSSEVSEMAKSKMKEFASFTDLLDDVKKFLDDLEKDMKESE